MRLLNRLHQYQRLWLPSSGEPQQVTVGELAERCFCSERHIRTQLEGQLRSRKARATPVLQSAGNAAQ